MQNPRPVTSRVVSLNQIDEASIEDFRQQAGQLPGVQEITVYLEDRIAYMKIDKKLFSDEDFDSLLGRHSYTG